MTLTQLFTAIANAIRGKKGTQAPIVAENFPSEIASIVTEPNLQSKSVTITQNGTTNVQADTGYDGLSGVEVVTNVEGSFAVPDGMKFSYSTLSEVPSNLDFSQATNFEGMFQSWQNLTEMSLIDTSNGINFENMFSSCAKLKTIPLLNTSKGDNFSQMFYACRVLEEIPLLNTSNGTDFDNMFSSCTKLETIPLLNTSNGTMFNSMFSGCKILRTIPIIDTSKGTKFSSMFSYCNDYFETAPQLDTTNATTFQTMFNGCTNLVNVPILNTAKIDNTMGFWNMFKSCPNLSDESLNNILFMMANATYYNTRITGSVKTLKNLGLTSDQATKCQSLSNYQAFLDAGWTTGY